MNAPELLKRHKQLSVKYEGLANSDDPLALARKVIQYIGTSTEDALMVFMEDGSTRDELEYRALTILLHS